MAANRERDQKAMNLLLERGIISQDKTLRDLVAISDELSRIGGGIDLAAWTFISPNYVYTGDDAVNKGKIATKVGTKVGGR